LTHPSLVFEVAFSPDGRSLAAGTWDEKVVLWDTETRAQLRELRAHTRPVRALAFSPDGKCIASGSFDGTVKLWSPKCGSLITTLSSGYASVNDVAFSPDGKTVAAIGQTSDSEGRPVTIWDVATHKETTRFGGSAVQPLSLAFSRDGKLLATGGGEFDKSGELRIWNPTTGRERANFPITLPVECVTFLPDGQSLGSCGWDDALSFWSIQNLLEKRGEQ
jgi:WD40 repeat protein